MSILKRGDAWQMGARFRLPSICISINNSAGKVINSAWFWQTWWIWETPSRCPKLARFMSAILSVLSEITAGAKLKSSLGANLIKRFVNYSRNGCSFEEPLLMAVNIKVISHSKLVWSVRHQISCHGWRKHKSSYLAFGIWIKPTSLCGLLEVRTRESYVVTRIQKTGSAHLIE